MSRIPNYDGENENAYTQDVEQFVVQEGIKYEKDFSKFLMDYVKEDKILKNFYIRFIYECEIVKIVTNNRTKIQLMELDMIVSNMESAPNTETLAIYDSTFHQKLFSIAEKEDFFVWFRLQSKDLSNFLSGFWNAIGYKTDYYWELMEIHREIYNAIESQNEEKAIEMMERHFSILLFQLLGTMFNQKES